GGRFQRCEGGGRERLGTETCVVKKEDRITPFGSHVENRAFSTPPDRNLDVAQAADRAGGGQGPVVRGEEGRVMYSPPSQGGGMGGGGGMREGEKKRGRWSGGRREDHLPGEHQQRGDYNFSKRGRR
ncbi:hypothetical protein Naga_100798g3, partial [Nannochloropsis gaditana]